MLSDLLLAVFLQPSLCAPYSMLHPCCIVAVLLHCCLYCCLASAGVDGETFATIERALDERTIGHNPERLNLMKVGVTGADVCPLVGRVHGSYAWNPTRKASAFHSSITVWHATTVTRTAIVFTIALSRILPHSHMHVLHCSDQFPTVNVTRIRE